jgi:hypothetical protein
MNEKDIKLQWEVRDVTKRHKGETKEGGEKEAGNREYNGKLHATNVDEYQVSIGATRLSFITANQSPIPNMSASRSYSPELGKSFKVTIENKLSSREDYFFSRLNECASLHPSRRVAVEMSHLVHPLDQL